ncbi:MAG: SGNH/GDSL hydrolase family protein [Clostridia bacterium]|nr:SGNH/GDSL hydrolase family protein [Clostridia bacterium]
MMNMKRILLLLGTLLLAGVLAVSLIACDNTPDQPDGTDGETTAAATDAPTEEPTEAPTEEITTEEITTEEITTEEETPMDPQAEMNKLNDLMQPIFAGNTVKNETVMFLDKGDVRSLLYPIGTVVSVTNYDGTVTYEEGKDYVIEDGKIKITEDSAIPVITRAKYYNYPAHPQINITANYEGKNVNIYWGEGKPMTDYQMNVTYTHEETWKGFISESKADVYADFINKLINGEDVTIFFYGDSITHGASASFIDNYSPYQYSYSLLFTEALADLYGYTVKYVKTNMTGAPIIPAEDYVAGDRGTITYINPSVGGWTSQNGKQNFDTYVKPFVEEYGCDLFLIAYGMNDAGSAARTVARTMKYVLDGVRELDGDCSLMFVSTMVPNPNATNGWYGLQDKQEPELIKTAEDYVEDGIPCAVACMTSTSKAILEHKEFQDYSGNNINHPNDFFCRVYAQTILQTLIGYENMK